MKLTESCNKSLQLLESWTRNSLYAAINGMYNGKLQDMVVDVKFKKISRGRAKFGAKPFYHISLPTWLTSKESLYQEGYVLHELAHCIAFHLYDRAGASKTGHNGYFYKRLYDLWEFFGYDKYEITLLASYESNYQGRAVDILEVLMRDEGWVENILNSNTPELALLLRKRVRDDNI